MPVVSNYQWAVVAAAIIVGMSLSTAAYFLAAWFAERRGAATFTVLVVSPANPQFHVYVLTDAKTAEEAVARVLHSAAIRSVAVALPGDWSELGGQQRLKP
jgi:hypothetical protein